MEKINKTSYEIWTNKTAMVDYFKVFRCKCYVLKTRDDLDKFYIKYEEHIFKGYSTNSKTYRCYNPKTRRIIESINVKII